MGRNLFLFCTLLLFLKECCVLCQSQYGSSVSSAISCPSATSNCKSAAGPVIPAGQFIIPAVIKPLIQMPESCSQNIAPTESNYKNNPSHPSIIIEDDDDDNLTHFLYYLIYALNKRGSGGDGCQCSCGSGCKCQSRCGCNCGGGGNNGGGGNGNTGGQGYGGGQGQSGSGEQYNGGGYGNCGGCGGNCGECGGNCGGNCGGSSGNGNGGCGGSCSGGCGSNGCNDLSNSNNFNNNGQNGSRGLFSPPFPYPFPPPYFAGPNGYGPSYDYSPYDNSDNINILQAPGQPLTLSLRPNDYN